MGKKGKAVFTACAAAAIAYSFLPSQAGKINRKLQRRIEKGTEPLFQRIDDEEKKMVYLTFDDGPHPVYTEKLLDLLQKYGIKASFFVVGRFAEENPKLILRMAEEGHTVGLHSYWHKSAMIQSPGSVFRDMEDCIRVMKWLEIQPKYYRPPWGHVNWFSLRMLRDYNLKQVLWDVMAEDWKQHTNMEEIQYKLLKRTKPGDIICLHDRQADRTDLEENLEDITESEGKAPPLIMIEALENTIPLWLEEGYQFSKL